MSAPRDPARAPLTVLEGIGPARARRFERLGVGSVRELLLLVPRRLESWSGPVSVAEVLGAEPGPEALFTVQAVVRRRSFLRLGGRRSLLRVGIEDDSGSIDVLFFNQPWLRERFDKGQPIEVHGQRVDAKGPALVARRVGSEANPLPKAGELLAVYPSAEGLAAEFVAGACRRAASEWAVGIEEPLPPEALGQLDLPALPDAVHELHAPSSLERFDRASRRVALEPVLGLQARLIERREARLTARGPRLIVDERRQRELAALFPFVFTAGQREVIEDLRRDLAGGVPMRRLLQGDVGSGKTAVGLWACLAAAAGGWQSAFLAPTELLAEQHFDGLRRDLSRAGLRAVLLTGSLPPPQRRAALDELASGRAQLAFGTHALFGDGVRFARLGLAVIDEQHRFGVSQRQRLLDKGESVHALLMTATPIPRSLALTVYGDLELSLLRERPPGRGTVTTRWVRSGEKKVVREHLTRHLERGEQVYWVVPRIESSAAGGEGDDLDDGTGAEERFETLRASPHARHGVELVHGRLTAEDRARRLERFRRGEVRLLVATTVIEVGVDVQGATLLVVEAAERLGLAQLHQLRGRVGRGPADSACLLLGRKVAAERFELLERSADGFELAEADLVQRGMGDLTGLRQAGTNAEGFASPRQDLALIESARELLAAEPELARRYLAGALSAAT